MLGVVLDLARTHAQHWERFHQFRMETRQRFDAMDQRFDQLESKVDSLAVEVDGLKGQVEGLTQAHGELRRAFDCHDEQTRS